MLSFSIVSLDFLMGVGFESRIFYSKQRRNYVFC